MLSISQLFSQSHKCGVTTEMGNMIKDQLLHNRNEMRDFVSVRNATIYIPVRFFLVAKNNGTDRPSESSALTALCKLNENYADQEIQFYLKEFKDVNNSTMHENPSAAFQAIKSQMFGKYNALNIFIVDQIGDSSNGTVLAYYQPPASGANRNDWLVADETFVDDDEVMTHEVGHFLSLNHTFFGWEEGTWTNGVPVPSFCPGNPSLPTELADGSNCAVAQDMMCDTPADYLHLYDHSPPNECTYTDNALDPTGAPINPDPKNFMNYNNTTCLPDLYFTDEQKEAIEMSLNSSSRNYIPKNDTPSNLNEITGSPTLVYPLSQDPPMPYNSVTMEWTAVTNADKYYLEATSQNETLRYIVEGATEFTVTEFEPNTLYFWTVTGFNDYSTCGGSSSQTFFKTGIDVTDTNEIPELEDWSIYPNPVKRGDMLLINFETNQTMNVDISLLTITGQNAFTHKNQEFVSGTTIYELDTFGIPSGIYLVSLRTANGVLTKRVSIH